jgi:hypothetical protein
MLWRTIGDVLPEFWTATGDEYWELSSHLESLAADLSTELAKLKELQA